MPMSFAKIEKLATKHGLSVRQCSLYHLQITGGALIVNYYPASKQGTVYVNGAVDGKTHVTPGEAMLIAKGEYRKQVSTSKEDRLNKYTKKKQRMYKKSDICFHCGLKIATPEEATVEHRIPLSKGGSNRDDNLTLAHKQCNSNQGNKLPKPKGR